MKKILLLQNENFLDSKVMKPTDYNNIIDDWKQQQGGNSGNKLFVNSIEKFLWKDDIQYDHYNPSYETEYINCTYDMVVWPTANIFGRHYVEGLKTFTEFFDKLKIPVYVIGAGIQCKDSDDRKSMAEDIGEEVKKFVSSVYATGGELALRGYSTKEFLDRITSNTAVVTGCPSIYQNGGNIQIHKNETTKVRAAINGSVFSINDTRLGNFLRNTDSILMDQDEFVHLLYGSLNDLQNTSKIKLLWRYSSLGLKLFAGDRVRLIYDVPVWFDYLSNNFDLSIGTRIHGNIAAILSGVPAIVVPCDERVRELAEFYDIPALMPHQLRKFKSLEEIYDSLDYGKFNSTFKAKFDAFAAFMEAHGISHDLNDTKKFDAAIRTQTWDMPKCEAENREYICKLLGKNPFMNIGGGYAYCLLKKWRSNNKTDFTVLKNK